MKKKNRIGNFLKARSNDRLLHVEINAFLHLSLLLALTWSLLEPGCCPRELGGPADTSGSAEC